MKTNQILIVVGIIALLIVILNWNKIFGSKTVTTTNGISNTSTPRTTTEGGRYRGPSTGRAVACDPNQCNPGETFNNINGVCTCVPSGVYA